MLEREQMAKAKSGPSVGKTSSTSTPTNEKNAVPITQTLRPRRKPRKLNREPGSTQKTAATATPDNAAETTQPQAATAELEALKSRVRGLEAKVEELYNVAESRSGRSPRRRGKGRKGSSTAQFPTISSIAEPSQIDDNEEADEELVRLEGELEVARRDLESYRPRNRPRAKRSTSGDTEYVEEIPREGMRGTSEGASDRQVTLSGSYRIPLPASVSMEDVKSIQSGVSAAQNVAKSFLEQRRAAQASRNPTPSATTTSRPKKTSSSTMEVSKEEGKSWGEWFGGYSVAISRAVKNIEAEAAIESQKGGTGPTGASSRSKKEPGGGGGTAASRRPKARQDNLGTEQVSGLMG